MKTWQWIALGAIFLLTLILEFTVLVDYDSHWWNSIPAFYAILGLLSCLAIIFVGKSISKIVKRDPDYYDR